jgi:DNA transformation protein
MKNMGPKSSEWLAAIGIHTLDDVARLGVVETYKRVKAAYPEKVTLNMLYGLQAALLDIPWNELPPDIKAQLREEVEWETKTSFPRRS